MQDLFTTLESIVNTATEIYNITENQETIILHGAQQELLSELARHKQEKIQKLDELERQFETLYSQNKTKITDTEDIKRLQTLVAKILDTKEKIKKSEEKNRRLYSSSNPHKGETITIKKPKSYVIEQYKKNKKPDNV